MAFCGTQRHFCDILAAFGSIHAFTHFRMHVCLMSASCVHAFLWLAHVRCFESTNLECCVFVLFECFSSCSCGCMNLVCLSIRGTCMMRVYVCSYVFMFVHIVSYISILCIHRHRYITYTQNTHARKSHVTVS